jgi:phosphomannomutase
MKTTGLMISVAGVRGIIGESLTPPVLARRRGVRRRARSGAIVVGRDARTSGPWCIAPWRRA